MVHVFNNKRNYYAIGYREENKVCYSYMEIFAVYFMVLDHSIDKLL